MVCVVSVFVEAYVVCVVEAVVEARAARWRSSYGGGQHLPWAWETAVMWWRRCGTMLRRRRPKWRRVEGRAGGAARERVAGGQKQARAVSWAWAGLWRLWRLWKPAQRTSARSSVAGRGQHGAGRRRAARQHCSSCSWQPGHGRVGEVSTAQTGRRCDGDSDGDGAVLGIRQVASYSRFRHARTSAGARRRNLDG